MEVRPFITKKEYNRIHAFKKHIDSLKVTDAGQMKAKKLLYSHPHLLDSITHIENIYYEQQINRRHSAKFLRKRKVFLELPILALPFVTMTFWALGGGKSERQK